MEYTSYLKQIKAALAPSTGCTEPAAIALNAATARAHVKGEIRRVVARLDAYLFKNAMGVGIPGADERGVSLCVALGITAGDPAAGMNALHTVRAEQLAEAKLLRELVTVEIAEEARGLYIETVITTREDEVRVITSGEHDCIARIEHAPFTPFTVEETAAAEATREGSLGEFVAFARTCPLEELTFLRDALNMNRVVYYRAMEEGLAQHVLPTMLLQSGSLYAQAKKMAGAASYARMHGIPLPVMTATGSGNQGLTLFLTVDAAARTFNVSEERLLRALALANLANVYIKSFIGPLSSVCACGVAAGLSAAIGVVFLMGGGEKEMLQAARNILGSVSGMICDGAKEGCASKVALSAGLAVEAACLAMEGGGIHAQDGILDDGFDSLIEHLGELVCIGMGQTNDTIVHIMKDEKVRRPNC
ncbi:MAG: L-serine ammonia-lyase, iron-sulfur-dependent, subunit alpha [Clostridiales bacterium]|nr:L-serine ammonia-lyase, iron-sulfur-dependent, subunit alpha [Clostridiales bacterium]